MKIRGIRIHDYFTGLCNQLMLLLHGIMTCICECDVDVVVVDDFKTDLYRDTFCGIEHVIDMERFREYIYREYGIVVIGALEADIRLKSVHYGTMTSFIDITEKVREMFQIDKDHLVIPKGVVMNSVTGDPAPNRAKSTRFTFQIMEGFDIVKAYGETLNMDCHFTRFTFTDRCEVWPKRLRWMETLLKNMYFHPRFYQQALPIEKGEKVHVIHVRLEYDASKHWSRENKMPPDRFYDLLAQKYIDCIQKHMNGGIIMALSHNSDNAVIDWIKETGRPYVFVEKDKDAGRELCGAGDMALAEKHADGVFIGNFDIYKRQGSTFSFFLMKRCRFQKHVLIDLDRIHEDPYIDTP